MSKHGGCPNCEKCRKWAQDDNEFGCGFLLVLVGLTLILWIAL